MQERKKNPSAFLRNIFNILQNTQLNDIIEWAPSGNGFVIKNLPEFESNILPQYFKHKKYGSFVRQLNMYGFHKQRNSMFQNCFLHGQFKRGEELPTDIKRKPEKKKKAAEQEADHIKRGNNWLSFSKELKQFFPQIAENILAKNQIVKKRPIILTDQKKSFDQFQVPSEQMEDNQEQEEEYVSKISLKGLIDEFEQNPETMIKKKSNLKQQLGSIRNDNEQSSDDDDSNGQMKDQFEQSMNDSSEKKLFCLQKMKQTENFISENQMSKCIKNKQKTIRQPQLSFGSINFLDSTLQSISGLSQVLIRQNQSLRKTHPIIKKTLLSMQQSKISYLKAQIDNEQKDLQRQNNQNIKIISSLLKEEKQKLLELIDVIEQQVEGLIESEDQLPISNTSIRYRLQRNS